MFQLSHRTLFAAALIAGAGFAGQASAQAPAGMLECNIGGGLGLIVTSTKTLSCVFHPVRGPSELYTGSISHLGFDLGATSGGHFSWAVVFLGPQQRHYPLTGTFAGPMIGLTVGGGADANALVGNGNTISLQPLAVSTQNGLNLTAGIGSLTLAPAGPAPVVYHRHHRHHHHY